MDFARLNVFASIDPQLFRLYQSSPRNLSLWIENSACDKCLPQYFHSLVNLKNNTGLPRIQTNFPSTLHVRDGETWLCNLTWKFREYGDYWLLVEGKEGNETAECTLYDVVAGRDPSILVLYAFLVYLCLALVVALATDPRIAFCGRQIICFFKRLFRPDDPELDQDLGAGRGRDGLISSARSHGTPADDDHALIQNASSSSSPPKKERLRSLDTFRGLSIVIMIFVNYEGGGFWFFKHSAWNGLTVADLVFPWFMFIMGTSLALSMKNTVRRSTPAWKLAFRIVKRTALLFLLGLTLNSKRTNDLDILRIPGVLQRFAVTYFIVASLELVLKSDSEEIPQTWWAPLRDIVHSWAQWFIIIAMIALHTAFTFLLPVPGCPEGYLGPGGLHEGGQYFNCTGGATGYIDRWVFGNNHMYGHPTCKKIYLTEIPFDPEGLLGCLTATFTVFLGLQAGKIVRTYGHYGQRIRRFASWSAVCGIAAATLCRGSQNDGWIPVNKNLWSLSFVLALASMAFFTLMVIFYIIDVKHWWSGAPLIFPGMNPIVLFMGHEILEDYFPLRWGSAKDHEMTLFFSCWGATFWTFVAWRMYKKKIFISL